MNNDSEKSVATYVAQLKERNNAATEALIGKMTSEVTLQNIGAAKLPQQITIDEAWFGCNIQRLMREHEGQTVTLLRAKFADWLLDMNATHPWGQKAKAYDQVDRMIHFDHSWTLEDFILFMDMAAEGRFGPHYGRPSRAWVRECQVKYNELKFEARERMAKRAQLRAEREMQDALYQVVPEGNPFADQPQARRPRSLADFIMGKNRLDAGDRALLAEKDSKRRNGDA